MLLVIQEVEKKDQPHLQKKNYLRSIYDATSHAAKQYKFMMMESKNHNKKKCFRRNAIDCDCRNRTTLQSTG